MSSKFDNVPVEDDTTILFHQEATLGEYEVLYEKWYWDGVAAESIIFDSNDVSDLEDDEVEQEVRSSPLVEQDTSLTLKRADDGFTYVNFNFKTDLIQNALDKLFD